MPRKKEGLGPAFSCRLHEAQDRELRKEAKKTKQPLVAVLRKKLAEVPGYEAKKEQPSDGQPNSEL